MLGLMQVINYMFQVGYSRNDIDAVFTDIINDDSSLDDLCLELGIEFGSPTVRQGAIDKVSRYESAMMIIEMRQGA